MTRKGIVNLYISKDDDTIESLSEKFDISQEIILRYNPLLKTKRLHGGMPLTIVSFPKEEEFEIEERVEKPSVPTEKEFNCLLKELAFYLKEGIASNAFYKENLEPVSDELSKLYESIAKLFKEFEEPKKKQQFIGFLKQLEKQYFEIIPILKKKDPELIKKYQDNLKITTANFMSFLNDLEKITMDKNVEQTFKRLGELFELLALKLLTLRFKSAQSIFREILSQFESFVTLFKFEPSSTVTKK